MGKIGLETKVEARMKAQLSRLAPSPPDGLGADAGAERPPGRQLGFVVNSTTASSGYRRSTDAISPIADAASL